MEIARIEKMVSYLPTPMAKVSYRTKPANKRMQPDQSARCAFTLAADAERYKA